MTEEQFIADGCDVERHPDGLHLRLNFVQESGGSRAVVLHREKIPQALAALQREILPGQVVPIDRESLQIGALYQLEGHQFGKRQDGSVDLTLFVNLLDQGRTVTLTLEIPSEDVKSLANYLAS